MTSYTRRCLIGVGIAILATSACSNVLVIAAPVRVTAKSPPADLCGVWGAYCITIPSVTKNSPSKVSRTGPASKTVDRLIGPVKYARVSPQGC